MYGTAPMTPSRELKMVGLFLLRVFPELAFRPAFDGACKRYCQALALAIAACG